MNRHLVWLLAGTMVFFSCASEGEPPAAPAEEEWIALFNGENLDGWIVKIAGYDLNDNIGNTFRVEDGILKVSYDQYDEFGRQFGSLSYKDKFSHYRLRVEYRFVGEQAAGGPEWGFRDSGVQYHGQDPATMTKEQEFPVCVEMNFIGGSGSGERPTGNVCSPGTHVVLNGELFTEQCASTSTKTIHGDEWVMAEVEVHGNTSITHRVNGEVVTTYTQPQLDETAPDAQRLLEAGHPKMVQEGYISLQSNSHPIEFRTIALLPLEE